jgi:very-short-patch-repair endonuclease
MPKGVRARNRKRDKKVQTILQREGWRVLRFWEHDIEVDPQKVAREIARAIEKSKRTGR